MISKQITPEKNNRSEKKNDESIFFMHFKRRWRRKIMCGLLIAGVVTT
jgi:hypothetical protein